MTYAIHICVPRVLALARKIVRCRFCERRTRHVVAFYGWYELWTCCVCAACDGRRGDKWTAARRIEAAQKDWKRAQL